MLISAGIFFILMVLIGVFIYKHKISTETYVAKLFIYFFLLLFIVALITYIIHYGHPPAHEPLLNK